MNYKHLTPEERESLAILQSRGLVFRDIEEKFGDMMPKWVYFLLGTVAGGFARYGLACLVYGWMGTRFPYGTLAVNLIGCFLMGFFDGLAEEKFLLGPNVRILLMTGFCGAFTTFSTFMLETSDLLKAGEFVRASLNVWISLVAGFVLFLSGNFLANL